MSRSWTPALGLVCVFALVSCSGTRPAELGTSATGLGGCPSSPNCVSSNATDDDHRIAALSISGSSSEAWQALREEVAKLPRTEVISERADYLYAECTSALMRYVDDLEFQLEPSENAIAVRSASRVGYSDMGVNRERVEQLRAALRARGVVE